MILTVFFDDRVETLTLPQKPAGHYVLGNVQKTPSVEPDAGGMPASRNDPGTRPGVGRMPAFRDPSDDDPGVGSPQPFQKGSAPLACIDGRGDHWLLTPAEGPSAVLSCPGSYLLQQTGSPAVLLLAEPVLPDRGRFVKVSLPKKGLLRIGRSPGCDLRFSSPVLSARHAVLIRSGAQTLIRDEDSTNGVYVNGKRVFAQMLLPGDLVFVAGLRLVFCGDHLAVSPPDGRLSFSSRLPSFHPSLKALDPYLRRTFSPRGPFLRPPRFLRQAETLELKIDPPPSPPSGDELPLALVLGSTLSMGMMSMVMLGSAVSAGNTASILMSSAMLFGSLLMPLVTKRYERKRRKKREILRKERYRAYLEETRRTIAAACTQQEQILRENAPSPAECTGWVLETGPRLWERTLRHDDLLVLRAGLGQAPLDAALSVPEKHFSLDDDPLREELFALCETPNLLQKVPVTWSAEQEPVFGAYGEPSAVSSFAAGLILQLAALYDSHDLKLVLVCDCARFPVFSFVRLLPHVWNDERDFRFLAEDAAGERELNARFEPLIEERLSMSEEVLREAGPCYVFFFPDPKLAAGSELCRRLLSLRKNLRLSVLAFAETLQALPQGSCRAAELKGSRGRLFSHEDPTGSGVDFEPDPVPLSRLRIAAKKLANLEPAGRRRAGFPAVLPLLQLFGAGRTEHLNCQDRWRESDPSRSLAAPVGVDQNGELLCLDLHERFHGPHALVAGMTGSGKSEWLCSYILSLALHFSPREVSFVLIDYKGGGMAGAFAKLPHTAGIMTNLSGSGIARTLISLESELLRRQTLFAEACLAAGVGSIDIYGYQRWVREGRRIEPLPHLFVICDEFAELKTKHPEFMTQLISAARIGRSLGVHLILATQKPGGVVDDQILSNSRARVCLKVQDRADSMEMLNRPEAASLTAAGRFYLQIGYNELFQTGQAAWAGAPYLPADHPARESPSVRVIDQVGHLLRGAALRPAVPLQSAPRQQDAVIRYLMEAAAAEDCTARPLWLEPLGEAKTLAELLEEYQGLPPGKGPEGSRGAVGALAPILGEYDDPARQRKGLLRLSLSEKGHTALFGSPGSGKAEALSVLLCSAVTEHGPDELRLYLLDLEAGTLAAFAPAPHTGGVLTVADEPARMDLLLRLLEEEAESRRRLFAPWGGDYTQYVKSRTAPKAPGKPLPQELPKAEDGPGPDDSDDVPPPRILLVIHNYTAFAECFPEAEERLSSLARDCARFGIHLLATAAASGGIRYRSLQNFSQLLTLQQSDAAEYSAIFGPVNGLVPGDQKGRGLIRLEKLLEFQTAALQGRDPAGKETDFSLIQKECLRLRDAWPGAAAPQLPVMPVKITVKMLLECLAKDKVGDLPAKAPGKKLRHGLAGGSPIPCGPSHRPLSLPIGYDCTALTPSFYDFSTRPLTPVLSESPCLPFFQLLAALLSQVGQPVLLPDPTEEQPFDLQIERTADGSPGPSPVLLIPDLPTLFESLSEEAAAQLRSVLERASRGGTCRIIFGGSPQELSSLTYEKWFRAGVSSRDGIWLGPGFSGQYLLKAPGAAAFDDCSGHHAVCLQNGRAVLVRLPEEISS